MPGAAICLLESLGTEEGVLGRRQRMEYGKSFLLFALRALWQRMQRRTAGCNSWPCATLPPCLLQVYIFGRGNVKPADKRYSRVRNDYALHFDPASFELESCGEEEAKRVEG